MMSVLVLGRALQRSYTVSQQAGDEGEPNGLVPVQVPRPKNQEC